MTKRHEMRTQAAIFSPMQASFEVTVCISRCQIASVRICRFIMDMDSFVWQKLVNIFVVVCLLNMDINSIGQCRIEIRKKYSRNHIHTLTSQFSNATRWKKQICKESDSSVRDV